jgi:flagellar basal-body rod protein FlgF
MERLAFNSSAAITEMRLARQVLANEMANMTTTGFKRSFEVSMKAFKADGGGFDSSFQPQAAHMDFIQLKPGPLIATGRDLDIHLNDHTVLGVQAPNGETAFTRRGDLQVSVDGVLQTGNGHPVMGEGNTPITVPPDLKVSIADDGGVYVSNPSQPGIQTQELVGNLMLRDASETPLTRREDGLFKAHDKPSGSDFASGPMKVSVISRALEGSNVNPQEAMVKLIEQARMFEQQVRMVKSSHDNDQAGASMMKLNG